MKLREADLLKVIYIASKYQSSSSDLGYWNS